MEQGISTKERLLQHCKTYPQLQLQDIFKFLHQSALGCEHGVSALDAAVAGIVRECADLGKACPDAPEALDGDYCRLPITCLKPETLGNLFFLSAKQEPEGICKLKEKLKAAAALAAEGLLPVSAAEFHREAAAWEAAGFPAVRHSAQFRECYAPAYRVVAKKFLPLLPLFAALEEKLAQKPVVLAVEGGSGSGKTTLADLLRELYGCAVVHADDFFLQQHQRTPQRLAQPGGNLDRERLLEEVLQPLSQGNPVRYRKFHCGTMTLGEAETLAPQDLVVVEGAYAMHPDLAPYYDVSVFLDISPEEQRRRILHRNGEAMAQRFFETWIPMERAYFAAMDVKNRCDLVLPVPYA